MLLQPALFLTAVAWPLASCMVLKLCGSALALSPQRRLALRQSTKSCKSLCSLLSIFSHLITSILKAGYEDVSRTTIFTGRPMSVYKTPYIVDWEENRHKEIQELTSQGVVPHIRELEKRPEISVATRPFLMGRVVAVIHVSKHHFQSFPSVMLTVLPYRTFCQRKKLSMAWFEMLPSSFRLVPRS